MPAFVFELDYEVDVPDLGKVKVDIAWGGMIYAIVDAASVGLKITSAQGRKLVEVGEKIKRAVQLAIQPTHPENPSIKGVSIVQFTEPIMQGELKLKEGEKFHHLSVIGSEFIGHIRGTTKVGEYDAVLPTVQGSAWLTSFKQVILDPTDPYPLGFRVGDSWHTPETF
ncbi:hypothetical protein LTR70_000559 [Exophiala xenobiotica]|nr:hypothetical protein LTR70_000559 [Exophiala xenobiotica]